MKVFGRVAQNSVYSTKKKKSEKRCFKTAKKSQGVIVSHSELNYSYEGEADF